MSALLKAEERAAQEQAFADGFLARYAELKAKYGFDGIDLSVESGLATPTLSAFRTVFKALHQQGDIVSLAPETPSLNPGEMDSFFEGSFNSYAHRVDPSPNPNPHPNPNQNQNQNPHPHPNPSPNPNPNPNPHP